MDVSHDKDKRRFTRLIPDWFKISNYDFVAGLDAMGWYAQIAVRQMCAAQLQNMHNGILSDRDDLIRQALAALRTKPNCSLKAKLFQHRVFAWCFNAAQRPHGLRVMTLHDLYLVERKVRSTLTKEHQNQAEILVNDRSSSGDARFFLAYPAWMDSSMSESCLSDGFLPLFLDLSLPSEILRDQFLQMLQSARQGVGGKPVQSTQKMLSLDRWAKIGILPCADLLLWAEEKETRLSDRLIADALAPTDYIQDRVRRVTRPLARDLMRLPRPDPDKLGGTAEVQWQRLQILAAGDMLDRERIRNQRRRKRFAAQSNLSQV